MPSVELTDEQVVELVKQLPPERQRAALLALASGAAERRRSECSSRKSNCGAAAQSAGWTGTGCRTTSARPSSIN